MALNLFGKDLFMSPAKKKEQDNNYYQKIFPLGNKQQEWENKIFDKLFPNNNHLPSLKYISFIRREMYIDGIQDDETTSNYKHYKKMSKRMKLSIDELAIIESLVKLENEAKSFDELPSIEKIKENINYENVIITK